MMMMDKTIRNAPLAKITVDTPFYKADIQALCFSDVHPRRNYWPHTKILTDVALPDVGLPDVALPDVVLPDVALPDVALADVAQPDVALPDVALPDSTTAKLIPRT